jgi:hypothetical protein
MDTARQSLTDPLDGSVDGCVHVRASRLFSEQA